jgi:hypothetical protein
MEKNVRSIKLWKWNCDLDYVEPELVKRGYEIVDNCDDADLILTWNEIKHSGWLKIIEDAHKKGKKVILYQQGIWGIDRVQPPFNEKLQSDIILVWGEGDKKRLESYGVKQEIIVTGSPILTHLKPKEKHKGKNVVFALEHWDLDELPENLMVARELRKLNGIKVITKALKGEHNLNLYDNVIATYRFDKNHLEVVANLLANTDLVVAISESTFALMAEAMDIPVVIADCWMPKERGGEKTYLDFRHPFTKAVTKVKLEHLNSMIKWQLKHPETLREERRQMSIENGGTDKGNPVNNICNVVDKLWL